MGQKEAEIFGENRDTPEWDGAWELWAAQQKLRGPHGPPAALSETVVIEPIIEGEK